MNGEIENKEFLNGKWQKINESSKKEYAERIAVGLTEIHSLIEQLNLPADIPGMPKLMFYNFEEDVSKLKVRLSGLAELAKRDAISANDISDLIQ